MSELRIDQEPPGTWACYTDPEGIIGRGKAREDAIIDYFEQELEDRATSEAKAKSALAEVTRQLEDSKALNANWLAANGPGGWIDNYRVRAASVETLKRTLDVVRTRVANDMCALLTQDIIDTALAKLEGK